MFALALLLQTATPVLENDYVRVWKDAAPCAAAGTGCAARVVVALTDVRVQDGASLRAMKRGDIMVRDSGTKYAPPTSGSYFEVAFRPNHPPVASPSTIVPPAKNTLVYDGKTFFVFEENLAVGDTRPKHGHSQRVVIQLNRTKLQQWPEGQPEVIRDIEPDRPGFNPPVIHVVKNVGDLPLRGIVIEFKPKS